MPTTLPNQTALVTGANRGIGKALVETFLKHGARKVETVCQKSVRKSEFVLGHGFLLASLGSLS